MLGHCLAAAAELSPDRLIVVVGHNGEQVAAHARQQVPGAVIVEQDHLGGTGHAVRVVLETVGTIKGTVVVTYADTPLLRGATLARLCAERVAADAAAAVLTARAPDPTGYGRIVRDEHGAFAAIVEHADATPEQRAIDEINSGMYAFDGDLLADAVKRVRTDNAQGEEYLTDAVSVLRADGYPVATVSCDDFEEVQGVNDLAQLAHARQVLNGRLLDVDDARRGADRRSREHLGRRRRRPGRRRLRSGRAPSWRAARQSRPGATRRARLPAAGHRGRRRAPPSSSPSARPRSIGAGAVVGPFAHLSERAGQVTGGNGHSRQEDDALLRPGVPRARRRRSPTCLGHRADPDDPVRLRQRRDLRALPRVGPGLRRVRAAEPHRADQPVDHGAADHGRRAEARVGKADHGGGAVLRVRPAGQEEPRPRADLGPADGRPVPRPRARTG